MAAAIYKNNHSAGQVKKLDRDWVLEGVTFSEKTKNLRNALGLSQGELGDRLGCGNQTVWNWEHDGPEPRWGTKKQSRGSYRDNFIVLLREAGLDELSAGRQAGRWAGTGPPSKKAPAGSEKTQKTSEALTSKRSSQQSQQPLIEQLRAKQDEIAAVVREGEWEKGCWIKVLGILSQANRVILARKLAGVTALEQEEIDDIVLVVEQLRNNITDLERNFGGGFQYMNTSERIKLPKNSDYRGQAFKLLTKMGENLSEFQVYETQ